MMDGNTIIHELLKNRINLRNIPFSERGSRLLVFRENEHFSIRLAERWFKLAGELSAYRKRLPIIDEWNLTDGQGNSLPMNVTTFPHRIDIQTPLGLFAIAYRDSESLFLTYPPVECGFTFRAALDHASVDRRGGVLRLYGNIRRNIAYTTNGRVLENTISEVDLSHLQIRMRLDGSAGNCSLILNVTPRLGLNRWIPDPDSVFSEALQRWQAWFASVPPVLDEYARQYYYAWWIMRAGLLSTRYYTTREVMTPSKTYYVGAWQWDNFFHALAYRHIDPRLAQDQLRILLDHQREDGMIPDAIHDEGTVTHLDFPVEADVTKPPLLAWAAWKLYEYDHDREFLDEIYGPLVNWNNWWFEKNDLDQNGLCEYQHPFSSGLDDSPLWDDGMPVESPDLNTYLCLQMEAMAKIAHEIGEEDDVLYWQKRAEELSQHLLDLRWDESAGLFWATHLGQRVNAITPMNLLPMITGRMPEAVTKRLVSHLTDTGEFWSKYPVPSVAMNDPKFNPFQMWRGPTWANINYLLIEGLFRCGYTDLAQELRRRTLQMLAGLDDIYEYYHPMTGENPPRAAPIYGWSAALFIDLAIQSSRGNNQVTGKEIDEN
jgi:glycogen debranching enzyme